MLLLIQIRVDNFVSCILCVSVRLLRQLGVSNDTATTLACIIVSYLGGYIEETFADQVRFTVLVALDTEIMCEPSNSANSTVATKDTTKDITTVHQVSNKSQSIAL